MADQAPQYLDAQGNPITARQAASAPKTLDAQGNPPSEPSSPAGRFFSGAWQNLNPMPLIEAIVDPAARNRMAIGMGMGMSDQYDKAQTAPTRTERIAHGVAAALPGLGPAAANAGEAIASGDYAGGAGQTLGLIAPPFLAEGTMRAGQASGQALRSGGAADTLDRAATSRFVDATAPKVGPNKLRLNRQMAKVAPDALREPDLGAFSREGLHVKVQNGLSDAKAALDEASDARLASQQVRTAPIVAAIDQQIDRLTAHPVEGTSVDYGERRIGGEQAGHVVGHMQQEPPTVTATATGGEATGRSVEPQPNSAQIGTLRQIRRELTQLGPVAPYEAVRRIREAWDKVALPKYLPSTAADALKSQGEATAAMKGAGAMREALAEADPASAAAYQKYSLYKSLDDVLAATQEAEQARPRVGRGIMARATGAVAGGASGGTGGAIIGVIVGEIANRAAQLAPTFQIVIARRMAGIADLIRGGNVQAATDMATRLKATLPPEFAPMDAPVAPSRQTGARGSESSARADELRAKFGGQGQ